MLCLELASAFCKKPLGAPGWLSQLSVRLWFRSWSCGPWVWAPHQALCWQLGAWSLLQILCLPLSLPLFYSRFISLSLSLSLSKKKTKKPLDNKKEKEKPVSTFLRGCWFCLLGGFSQSISIWSFLLWERTLSPGGTNQLSPRSCRLGGPKMILRLKHSKTFLAQASDFLGNMFLFSRLLIRLLSLSSTGQEPHPKFFPKCNY